MLQLDSSALETTTPREHFPNNVYRRALCIDVATDTTSFVYQPLLVWRDEIGIYRSTSALVRSSRWSQKSRGSTQRLSPDPGYPWCAVSYV